MRYSSQDIDEKWQHFEKTGSIISYLKYKNVYNQDRDEYEEEYPDMEDEPIGYR